MAALFSGPGPEGRHRPHRQAAGLAPMDGAMSETVYSAAPELADPAGFLARAGADLGAALPAGWQLFRAQLRARRRRALLGGLWLLAPAAAATLLCVYLQSRRLFAVGPTELPYALHVLAGIVLWQTFHDALNAPLARLSAERQIVTRSRVPHEAVLLSGLWEVALNGAVRLAALAAALALLGFVPAPSALLLPLGLAALALLGFALGLVAAPFGLLWDDVRQALLLVAGFWFFMTPIVYPGPAAGWLRLNPVTPLLETARSWLAGPGVAPGFFLVLALAAAALVLAWLLYRLARPHVTARLG